MKKNIIAKLAAASLGLFILTAGAGFAKAEAARAAENDKASGITEFAEEDPAEDLIRGREVCGERISVRAYLRQEQRKLLRKENKKA